MNTAAIFFTAIFVFVVSAACRLDAAKAATPQKDGVSTEIPSDDLQRSYRLDTYKIVADSGASRGENIYFYKCWMCHNQYAKSAPLLKDLFQRDKLASGDPASDDNVTAKIKEGGAGMPAFRTSLSDADIADLRAYFRSGKCCVEGENPPANPWYRAETQRWPVQSGLTGGATGSVRIASGDSPEGVGVQLIAPNGIRTTVYTDADGKFEFPKMQSGSYTLRIPTPVPFKPYRRDSVSISSATKLDDIVLERVAASDDLTPSAQLESQLSGAEILWNLSGTAEEKAVLQKNCSACHSWQQIFRNRYDERSWGLIVDRMIHFAGTSLAVRNHPMSGPDPEYDILVKFFSRVRGPNSLDAPLRVFPLPRGESTKVIVTEYELPRQLFVPHDVAPDAQGNIWFTSHKTRYIGKLDPKTGIVTEYTIPLTPGAMPGTQHIAIDKNGIAWISENWAHQLDRLDPQTGQVRQFRIDTTTPINVPNFGNFAMAPDGFVWDSRGGGRVRKISSETGKIVQEFQLQADNSFDSVLSPDGKQWAGSGLANRGNTLEMLDIETGKWLNLNSGGHVMTARRGGFDPFGNVWFGGSDGAVIELDAKAARIEENWPPIAPHPYTDFYEAMPDKNGEVWAGVLHGRQMLRFDPKRSHWSVYQMPEPYSYDRRTYIDSLTRPVTVWFVDYNGYLVRVQPRD